MRKIGVLGVSLALVATLFVHGATAGAKAASATCAPANAPGGDWPSYGHDLHNTRNQTDEHVIGTSNASSLAPAWSFSIAAAKGTGGFQSTPVEADGCVFAATNTGWVFAVNADTG